MTKRDIYLFAGGGTGGHLTPGLAVAAELQAVLGTCRIAFVGSSRPVERQMVEAAGYEHVELPVESTETLRRNPVRFLWRNWQAYRLAISLLAAESPTGVIGLGGFASVPLVLAANRRRIPTLLLEQNTIPGRANRFLSRGAGAVCLTYPQTQSRLSTKCRSIVTGNPVRAEIAALAEAPGPTETDRPPTLLVLGGSQGAAGLNDAVQQMLVDSPQRWSGVRIIHQTGAAQYAALREFYARSGLKHEVEPFFTGMADLYRKGTLVVSRAGATTLAELACAALPAVLVPYPHAADNHQLHNAEVYRQAGGAEIVLQRGDPAETAAELARVIGELLGDRPKREACSRAMRRLAQPKAARNVVEVLQTLTATPIK